MIINKITIKLGHLLIQINNDIDMLRIIGITRNNSRWMVTANIATSTDEPRIQSNEAH